MTSPRTGSADDRLEPAVLVSVGALQLAIAGRVMRSLPAIRPLPPAVHHQDRDFPVLDLPRLLGVDLQSTDEGGELMLLLEQGPLRRALVVDGLEGFSELEPTLLQPVPDIYPEAERRLWRGLLPQPGGRVLAVPRLAALPTGATGRGEGSTHGEG